MGSDLYWLGKDIVERSHPRLCALLREIRVRLLNDHGGQWDELIDKIDQELRNATIQ